MRNLILCGLLAGGWIVAACHAAHGQSCYSAPSYSRSYSYSTPSYSYSAPYSYAPAYVAPTYKAKEYKNDAYFVRMVAFFPVLDVPTYGAAVYAQPGQLQTPQTPAKPGAAPAPAATAAAPGDLEKIMTALTTINKAVELIDARLNRVEGGNGGGAFAPKQGQPQPQPAPKQAAPAPQEKQQTALQIVQNKCAACHAPSVAPEVGGGFVMLTEDGKLEKLSGKVANKVIGRSHAGTMPPTEKDRPKGFTAKLPDPLTDPEVNVLVAFYTGQIPAEYERRKQEVSDDRKLPKVNMRSR